MQLSFANDNTIGMELLSEEQANMAQDVAEIIATVCSLVLGFHLVSMAMRIPRLHGKSAKKVMHDDEHAEGAKPSMLPLAGLFAKLWRYIVQLIAGARSAHQHAAMVEPSAEPAAEESGEAVAEAEAAPAWAPPIPMASRTRCLDSRQSAHFHALLEGYAVFGADAGAWSQASTTDSDVEDPVPPDSDKLHPPQWKSLFEHYGAFGAAAGTWSKSAEDEDMQAEEDGEADTESEGYLPLQGFFSQRDSPEPRVWTSLLEQYGVFGAAAGAWSRPAREDSVAEEKRADEEDEQEGGESTPFQDHLSQDRQRRNVLFEHYGMFGAAAGTWTEPVEYSASSYQCSQDRQFRNAVFEHYGLFGAAAGTWTKSSAGEVEEEEEREAFEEQPVEAHPNASVGLCADEVRAASCGERKDQCFIAGKSVAWSLMEQYGVFEAAHGAWSSAA